MISTAKNLITGVVKTASGLAGGGGADRSEAARKAVRTREAEAKKRSQAARKAAATRQANAQERSAAAKRGAKKRTQRKARVDAMVEATRRD